VDSPVDCLHEAVQPLNDIAELEESAWTKLAEVT